MTNPMEQWKPIPGYETCYAVSDQGRVMRTSDAMGTKQGRLLIPASKDGYLQVCLCVSRKQRTFTVHRLVALAFLGERPEGMQINHIDCDKQNNRLSNLEYCTRTENLNHAIAHNLFASGELSSRARLTQKQADDIRELASTGVTRKQLATQFGVSKTTIQNILTFKVWTR